MREELKELEFSESAKSKQSVVEGEDLFDGDLSAGGLVESCNHGAICALSKDVEDTIIITCQKKIIGTWVMMFGRDVDKSKSRH